MKNKSRDTTFVIVYISGWLWVVRKRKRKKKERVIIPCKSECLLLIVYHFNKLIASNQVTKMVDSRSSNPQKENDEIYFLYQKFGLISNLHFCPRSLKGYN